MTAFSLPFLLLKISFLSLSLSVFLFSVVNKNYTGIREKSCSYSICTLKKKLNYKSYRTTIILDNVKSSIRHSKFKERYV